MPTVLPTEFTKIFFDADQIKQVIEFTAQTVPGAPAADQISVHVDEDLPTGRVRITSMDPVVFEIESGAFERKNEPRHFGPKEAGAVLARLLLEWQDRSEEGFGAPPLEEPKDLGLRIAWDVTLYGRVSRLGFKVFQPRYRYDFRNRHGFSDAADAVFDQLWAGDLRAGPSSKPGCRPCSNSLRGPFEATEAQQCYPSGGSSGAGMALPRAGWPTRCGGLVRLSGALLGVRQSSCLPVGVVDFGPASSKSLPDTTDLSAGMALPRAGWLERYGGFGRLRSSRSEQERFCQLFERMREATLRVAVECPR